MNRDQRFDGLATFLEVARQRSFRGAARRLGVTPGAVSQAIGTLEKRVGAVLFLRTTRSVALTDDGEALLSKVGPAADTIAQALAAVGAPRADVAGLVRLSVPRMAVPLFVTPALPVLRQRYPHLSVEIRVEDAFVDIQAAQFDAGLRIGEFVAKDMIAVRLSPPIRWCVVGAPAYFAKHGHPRTPKDLLTHATIAYRSAETGARVGWDLERRGRRSRIDVGGDVIVNDGVLALELARRGVGLCYCAQMSVDDDLARGSLETTLDAYASTSSGAFLYFPAGAQKQPRLRAVVDTLKELAMRKRPRSK